MVVVNRLPTRVCLCDAVCSIVCSSPWCPSASVETSRCLARAATHTLGVTDLPGGRYSHVPFCNDDSHIPDHCRHEAAQDCFEVPTPIPSALTAWRSG